MSKKQVDAQAKRALEAERVALKKTRMDLERAARAWQRERQAAVGALKLICTYYGVADWPDTKPLDKVLVEDLLPHLRHTVPTVATPTGVAAQRTGTGTQSRTSSELGARTPRDTPVPPPPVQAPPPPVRAPRAPAASPARVPPPTRPVRALPDVVHRPLLVKAQSLNSFGWKMTCTCGHLSALFKTKLEAREYGRAHLAQAGQGPTLRAATS